MEYTYQWSDPDKKTLRRRDENGEVAYVPTVVGNADYDKFLQSNVEVEDYIASTVIDNILDLDIAKAIASKSVRDEAYRILQPTDWVVTREIESGKVPSVDITQHRTNIRSESAGKISMIESKQNLSDLANYLRSEEFSFWPKQQ